MRRVLLATSLVGLTLPVVGAPTPAVADGGLGGYTASAQAAVVHVEVYEPALPIPTTPQGDATVGFSRALVDTGPSSQALASYLWPGDTLGDGLGLLTGNDAFDYRVKTKSAYPATDTSPSKNAVQLTDGNGMATSADEEKTEATVNALELGTNVASGTGSGLCTLLQQCAAAPTPAPTPGPELPGPLADAVKMRSGSSHSVVTVSDKAITTVGEAKAAGLSLMAGLITIDSVRMSATSSSDAVKGTSDGVAQIAGLRIAGQQIDLGDSVDLGGKKTTPPKIPADITQAGINVQYLVRDKSAENAAGSLNCKGLVITIDSAVLSSAIGSGALTDPIGSAIGEVPNLGPLAAGLLKLGTKYVITVGDVRTAATASPEYSGSFDSATSDVQEQPATPSGAVAPPAAGAPTGATAVPAGAATPAAATNAVSGATDAVPASSPFQLPGLGRTPSLLLLSALALAGLTGWLFRAFGSFFFGVGDCLLGASVGVPNLREG